MARKILNTQEIRDLLKKSAGFFTVLDKANILKAESGNLVAELTVGKEHVNHFGTLHGGLAATLIDTFTCSAILTHEKSGGDVGTSTELHIRYFKSAIIGDELIINAQTERVGKYLAYMKCDIRNKHTEELISKGTVTLFMLRSTSKN